MKREHVVNCSFSNWYPLFKQWTIKSEILKLPDSFIEYLLKDGVVLPAGGSNQNEHVEVGLNEDEVPDDWSDCEDESLEAPEFPSLQQNVEEAIEHLGGVVFPKLNWTSPRDASWISIDGTLRCKSFQDICLLLKSSDFIAHDLTKAFEDCEDSTDSQPSSGFELVLRKWTEISPSTEFRCFVRRNELVAISQRDTTNCYKFLLENEEAIHKEITKFYHMKICSKFPESCFVFDVYRYADQRIKLIDINPFSSVTDSLLFSWKELKDGLTDVQQSVDGRDGELRMVTNHGSLQPSEFLSYRMPKDVIDVASGEDINKLVDFLDFNKLT